MPATVTATQIAYHRITRSGLITPFNSPITAAHTLAGMQAQVLPWAAQALWQRSPLPTERTLNTLLYDQRTLVKLWGQRSTLHVYPAADWPLVYSAMSVVLPTYQKRVVNEGRSLTEFHANIAELTALAQQRGEVSRSTIKQTRPDLDDRDLEGYLNLLFQLALRGVVCHGQPNGSESVFVERTRWLPNLEWTPPTPDAANLELARRYFHAYAPATFADFAYWRGVSVSAAKRTFAQLEPELTTVTAGRDTLYLTPADLPALLAAPPPREAWPIRLLPAYDVLVLAHKDKSWLIDAAHYKKVWRVAAIVEATLFAEGRLWATWRYKRKAKGVTLTVAPFEPLPAHIRAGLEAHAAQLAAFLELPLLALEVV